MFQKKFLLLFVSLVAFAGVSALGATHARAAETVYACKKRDTFVYQTFYWAMIQKKDSGELVFIYGNGIEDQMLNIRFTSPVTEVEPGHFQFDNGEFQVDVVVKGEKLSFALESEGKKSSRKGLRCEPVGAL